MDDIVEELRNWAYIADETVGKANLVMLNGDIFTRSADEIERLRDLIEDKICIDCGDEVVVIDGNLATKTIQKAVEQYINKALSSYINNQNNNDELIEWQEMYYKVKKDRDRLKENRSGN